MAVVRPILVWRALRLWSCCRRRAAYGRVGRARNQRRSGAAGRAAGDRADRTWSPIDSLENENGAKRGAVAILSFGGCKLIRPRDSAAARARNAWPGW